MSPAQRVDFQKIDELRGMEGWKELINYIQEAINNKFLLMVGSDDEQEIIRLNYRMKELTIVLSFLTKKPESRT